MDQIMSPFWACLNTVQQTLQSSQLSWKALLGPHEITVHGRKYQVMEKIGEGGYSIVYRVVEIATQSEFALKKVILGDSEETKLARKEVAVLKLLPKHANLLCLIDSSVQSEEDSTHCPRPVLYMIFPLFQTSLFDEIVSRREKGCSLTILEILTIFCQVCEGLLAMHTASPALAHRDIKPQNVLLKNVRSQESPSVAIIVRNETTDKATQQQWEAVITDFGSTSIARVDVTSRREALALQEDAEAHCSAPYRAPELFDVQSSCQIDERIDVWSLGCLLYFCLCGVSPFETEGSSLPLAVQNGRVSWPQTDEIAEDIKDLVHFCLTLDPQSRPQVTEVLARARGILAVQRQPAKLT